VAMTTMVFFQFFQAWNSRSEMQSVFRTPVLSNPFLFFSLIGAFFAQLAVLYVPALQWVFRTVPLSVAEWLGMAAVTSTVVIAVEADKWARRRRRRAS
jgi:magnesium-transporting ATPase (P-type)